MFPVTPAPRAGSYAGTRSALGGALITTALILVSACQAAPAQPPAKPDPSAPADRLNGTVQGIEGTRVSLADGSVFALGSETRITRSIPATPVDLQAGEFAAITAKLQPDGTLLASVVNIFATTPGPGFLGQFPMDGGDLMTNSEIVTVDPNQADAFSVKFPGGNQDVRLAPGARMSKVVPATPVDIVPGSTVSASVVDGVARSVSLR